MFKELSGLTAVAEHEIEQLDVLYLAKYVRDIEDVPPVVHPEYGRELYTKYEVYRSLLEIGLAVTPCRTLAELLERSRSHNFIFNIYNREPVRNPETVVSSILSYLGRPYLGAPPNLRALAEDKYLTKHLAKSIGLPVTPGAVYVDEAETAEAPPFPGPFFVKPRFGANSEGVGPDSAANGWNSARDRIVALLRAGEEALVEPLIPGYDLTIPVLAGRPDVYLPTIRFDSELPYGIATEDQKRLKAGGRKSCVLEDADLSAKVAEMTRVFVRHVRPFDYLRVDFRVDDRTGEMTLLEYNLTCNLGTHAAIGRSIAAVDISHRQLIDHLVAVSARRQGVFSRHAGGRVAAAGRNA